MRRHLILAFLVLALPAAACGGGGSSTKTSGSTTSDSQSSTTDSGFAPQPTPNQPLATPTPARETSIAVTVVNGTTTFKPIVADFRKMATTEIQGTRGVPLSELARQVGASPESIVTVQGYRNDMKTIAFVRQQLSAVASNTVFAIDDAGHVNLISSALPQIEWLRAIDSIAFHP